MPLIVINPSHSSRSDGYLNGKGQAARLLKLDINNMTYINEAFRPSQCKGEFISSIGSVQYIGQRFAVANTVSWLVQDEQRKTKIHYAMPSSWIGGHLKFL
jgi:hypothetical protein